MQRHHTAALIIASLSTIALVGLAGAGLSNQQGAQPERQGQAARGGQDIGQRLIDGLNATEGCYKVITAQTSQGTNTIIAWFENKAAVETWYYSKTHSRVMNMVGSDVDTKKPMAHVKDENIPVMVMASITLAEKGVLPGPMPVSQISIELYTPLDAGASINGRLMPEEIKLKHFNSISVDPDQQPDG